MRYLIFTALALVLLVGAASALPNEVTATIVTTATGGDVYQEAYNYVDDSGVEGAVVTETIELVADATGEVTQDADNVAYVGGNGAVVTQSISMDATGENIWQNWWYGYGNYANVYGDEGTTTTQTFTQAADAEDYVYQYAENWLDPYAYSMSTQSISQAAVAGGDVDQEAYNGVNFYGDGSVAEQSVSMEADAGGYAYQYGYNDADMHGDYGYSTTGVYQSAIMSALAGDYVYQDFYNYDDYATGASVNDQSVIMSGTAGTDVYQYLGNYIELYDAVSEDTQVLSAAGFASDGNVYQDAYNEIYWGLGDDLASQTITLSGVATADVYQLGYNWADLDNNANLGQLASIAGEGSYVEQYGYNDAYFGETATIAQALAFSAISDDEGVDQYGGNYAENYYAYGGDSTNWIGQSISAAAIGGDESYQDLANYANTYWGLMAPSTYTIAQSNVATLSANDVAVQYMYNWIDWWYDNTGSTAMAIDGDASADLVYQYHENWIDVY